MPTAKLDMSNPMSQFAPGTSGSYLQKTPAYNWLFKQAQTGGPGNFGSYWNQLPQQASFSPINTDPIWSQQQIQQQVADKQAMTSAGAAGMNQQMQQAAVGRGFGVNSGGVRESANNNLMRALVANTQLGVRFPFEAAGANAAHVLAAEQARAQMENARAQAQLGWGGLATQMRGQDVQQQAAYLQALNGAMRELQYNAGPGPRPANTGVTFIRGGLSGLTGETTPWQTIRF